MSYSYWNDFINMWRADGALQNEQSFHPWTFPSLVPLMNSPTSEDYSLFYLPEPWWGNNGSHILNSVVINYNPGKGNEIQHFQKASNLFEHTNYSDFANSEATGLTDHFSLTNRWHRSKRASRIFNTLARVGVMLGSSDKLQNHLSIELIPWHTQNIETIDTYISQNLQPIFDNSFIFAANESKRIANDKLRGKVILRINAGNTIRLLNDFLTNGICDYNVIVEKDYTPSGKAGYFKFSTDNIRDVEFVSIWGIRNDFPSNSDMDWIFNNVV